MTFVVQSGITDLATTTLTDPRPLLMASGFSFENDVPNATPPVVTFDCNQSGTNIAATTGTIPSGIDNNTVYQLSLVAGSLPSGLTAGSFYFLTYLSATSFQLRPATASGTNSTGTVITLTAATGQASLKACGAVWNSATIFTFTAAAPYGRNSYIVGRNFVSPVNLSTGLFSCQFQFPEMGTNVYGYMLFIDINGHWVRFRMSDPTHLMATPIQTCMFNMTDDYTTLPGFNSRSSSSFDITQVVKIIAMNSTPGSGQRSACGIGTTMQRVGMPIISGSGTLSGAMDALIAANPININYGNDIYRLGMPIQFGDDGVTPLSFVGENGTIFFPQIADAITRFNFHIRPNDFKINIKPGASDSFVLTNTQIKGVDSWIFNSDAAVNPSVYNLAGCTIINANVSLGAFPHDRITFVSCPSVIQGGASLDNCVLTKTKLECDALDIITNCSFVSNGFESGLEISDSGTYSSNGNTFNSFGADGTPTAAIYNKSNGIITINLIGSSQIPTIQNISGASTFITRNVNITAINMLDGTRTRLYNMTKNIELDNSVVSGSGGYLFVANLLDVNISEGDTIKFTATYINGITAKKPFEYIGTVSANGIAIISSQDDDSIYNSYGINGAIISGFEADYIDTEVNLTINSNFYLKDLYAWWCYNLTTENGIRNFIGGITAIDEGNLQINNNVVNIYLDNTTAYEVWALDNLRLYRVDGARPVKNPTTGGGGIDVEWRSPVLFVNDSDIDLILRNTKLIPALL